MSVNNTARQLSKAAKSSLPALTVVGVMLGGVAISVVNAMSPEPTAAITSVEQFEATPGATLTFDREEAELGQMALSEVATADFKMTNSGTEPVKIGQVTTSCMCTYARVQLPEETSPDFNMAMHNSPEANAWTATLQPGESAVVTIIYKPALMPVEGSVARNVKFATNDPQNPQVELGVHATVVGG